MSTYLFKINIFLIFSLFKAIYSNWKGGEKAICLYIQTNKTENFPFEKGDKIFLYNLSTATSFFIWKRNSFPIMKYPCNKRRAFWLFLICPISYIFRSQVFLFWFSRLLPQVKRQHPLPLFYSCLFLPWKM